jgi:hypothetical protein
MSFSAAAYNFIRSGLFPTSYRNVPLSSIIYSSMLFNFIAFLVIGKNPLF